MDCSLPGSSVHGIVQARILEWVAMPSSGDLLDPGVEPKFPVSPVLQADPLPAEPPGKPTECILLILTGKGASLQGRLFLPPILISVNSYISVYVHKNNLIFSLVYFAVEF